MPDPTIALALVLLVALAEASRLVRLPVAVVIALVVVGTRAELLPVALLGATGSAFGRVLLALAARRGRDRSRPATPAARAHREAIRARLAGSPTYARATFFIAALPGVPPTVLFPMLGAMRAPLWPAVAGTIIGRVPLLALTGWLFVWLAELLTTSRHDATMLLGSLALLLLLLRTSSVVDWDHRRETGRWRVRDVSGPELMMSTMLRGTRPATAPDDRADARTWDAEPLEGELVEGELVEPVDDVDLDVVDDERPRRHDQRPD